MWKKMAKRDGEGETRKKEKEAKRRKKMEKKSQVHSVPSVA